MRKFLPLWSGVLLLMALTPTTATMESIAPPSFSRQGGLYENAQAIVLTAPDGAKAFYTLDGSEPDKNSQEYVSPIIIDAQMFSPRTIQSRVAQEKTPLGTVVRAIAITPEGVASEVVTNTYFIGENIKSFFGVPITVISAAPKDFWDQREGIYTNYSVERSIPANVEYFETDGTQGFSRRIEVKLSGHYSKNNPKKNLRIYFSKGSPGDSKYLEYNMIDGTTENIFSDTSVEKFGKITFRTSDYSVTDVRDVLTQKIGRFTRADTANSHPTALMLNGEFLGIYACREQFDNRYLQFHYPGIDNNDAVMLKRDWTDSAVDRVLPDTNTIYTDRISYSEGPENNNIDGKLGEDYYRDLYNYVQSLALEKDINDPEIYAELCQYVDIDNFIDYLAVYVYAANDDWPGNNYILWRTTEESSKGHLYANDGKWRFMIHDFDIAYENSRHDTLRLSALEKLPVSEARHPEFATKFFGAIFKNRDFAARYAQRYAAYLSTAMSPENVSNLVEDLISEYEGSKTRDLMRWNFGSGSSVQRLEWWKENMNAFCTFAQERPEASRIQLTEFLSNDYNMQIEGNADFSFICDTAKGSLSVSGALVLPKLYGEMASSFTTTQFAGIPLTIEGIPNDGMKVKGYILTQDGASAQYDQTTLTLTPHAGSKYTVEIVFEEGTAVRAEATQLKLMRQDSFEMLETGKKWPVDVMVKRGDIWEKAFAITVSSSDESILSVNGNILLPQKKGEAVVSVAYEGLQLEIGTKIIQ
ncbi:MAG: CotH kinase family protein [Clostridia bacterium]|nr:CotH kinase family protein [Clostridia bacterium]